MTGQARLFDPETSQQAAAVQSGRTEKVILEVFHRNAGFSVYGATDDELCDVLSWFYAPTVKTARSRLTKAGLLFDSGQRRPSNRGRDQIVWARR